MHVRGGDIRFMSLERLPVINTLEQKINNRYSKLEIDTIVNSQAKITKNNAQSIPNTTYTKIQYDDEVYDTLNEYDSGVNYRFTCSKAGTYMFKADIMFTNKSWTAGEQIRFALYKNGVILSHFDRFEYQGNNTEYLYASGVIIDKASIGSYYEVYIYQGSGGALNTHTDEHYNSFTIQRLG